MTDIPAARERLIGVARNLMLKGDHETAQQIEKIVYELMFRREVRGSRRRGQLKEEVQETIRTMARVTDLNLEQIADKFGATEHEVLQAIRRNDG